MLKKHHKKLQQEATVDLTPMIDMTFLLVMFFVLTAQISSLNLEEVILPVALKAADASEEKTLIINVTLKNDETREGEIVFNGNPVDPAGLQAALKLEVDVDARRRGMEAPAPGQTEGLSKLEVLVRADHRTRGEYLRQVFMACQKNGLYKVKISALQP